MISKRLSAIFLFLFLIILYDSAFSQEQQYFGKNKVQYKTFDWYYIQSEDFDVYFYRDAQPLATFAVDVLEDAYDKIRKELNYDLKKRVPVIVYCSHNEFQQTNVIGSLIEEGVGGFTEAFKNRVVIPFSGSYEDFRHVLHHELTHALIFDMLYGNTLSSLISRQYLFRLPLWFSEGYAEYSSRHGWDTFSDMYMRDATINGYLAPLEWAGGFLVYKEGQSAIAYLVEKYGEEKITEVLAKGKLHLTIDKALKASIGKTTEEFEKEWMLAMRKEYWPEIAIRTEPKDIAKPLTDHEKDNSFYNEKPEFAPSGDRLAFFSDRSSYPEILIISTIDGAIIERLLRGAQSAQFESFHAYQSGLSWSSDGKNIAFVSKSHGYDKLMTMNVRKKKISDKFKFKFDSISSPDFSPDGNSIVFSATKNGKSDLYLADFKTGTATALTDDLYDDKEPDFMADGGGIIFSSDRPSHPAEDDTAFTYGTYNIFKMDIPEHSITAITDTTGINTDPAISPDGGHLCFVSDRNGICNLYIKELPDGKVYPITNALSGCFSPAWSPDGDQIAFSGFQKAGFDIFLMKKIKPIETDGNGLAPTPFVAKDPKSIFVPVPPPAESPADSVKSAEKSTPDFSDYVFSVGKEHIDSEYPEIADTTKTTSSANQDSIPVYKDSEGNFIKKKYKLKFTPDYVAGDLGYDTYYGFSGQSFFAFSDIFGNHNLFISTNLGNFLDQLNVEAYYFYTAHRIDYGIGLFHSQNYYIDPLDRLFSDRIYGGVVSASWPFSKFTRLELSALHLSIGRKYHDPPFDDSDKRAFETSLSLINDTVLWGITGPVNGHRYALHYRQSINKLFDSNLDFQTTEFDYRKYLNINTRYLLATRFSGGASFGKTPQEFFLGGTANWIGRKTERNDIYGIRDIYFGSLVTPLRGYNYYETTGDHYALMNLEFRYPFIEYFKMKFPLPMTISYVNGVWFYDMGATWFEDEGFRGVKTVNGTTRLNDLKAGFGFGARANLGIFVLKYDAAWRTDWNGISEKPRHYFSFGAEF